MNSATAHLGEATTRVLHPFRPHRKGWGIALCATALLCVSSKAQSQSRDEPCNFNIQNRPETALYPPIARAAHVEGLVIATVNVGTSGAPQQVDILSGPEMLRATATKIIQDWQAKPYGGSRACPVVIDYRLFRSEPRFDDHCEPIKQTELPVQRIDASHFSITANDNGCCCDLTADVTRVRQRFLFVHWYTKSS